MDIFQPVHIDFVEALRHDLHLIVLYRAHCWRCQRYHLDEPLLRNQWLNHGIAALAVAERHHVVFSFHNQTKPIQFFHQVFTSFKAILPGIRASLCGHLRIEADDLHTREIVTHADLEVYGIMGRRHFYRASAEGEVHSLICNNRYFAANYGQDRYSPNHIFVARVFRINGHSSITQDCLRASGGNGDIFDRLTGGRNKLGPYRLCNKFGPYRLQRIAYIGEGTQGIDMIDLQV